MKREILKKDIIEFSTVFVFVVGLLVISLSFVVSIVKNYVNVNSVLAGNFSGPSVYLYLPKENENFVKKIGLIENYKRNIKYIESFDDFNVIEIHTLKNIKPKYPLLLLDNFVITNDEKYQLKKYLENGGSLIFNFNIDKKFQNEITNLKYITSIKQSNKNTFFLVSNLLSPIQIPESKRLDVVLYDSIPLFKGKEPILSFTNWAMSDGIYKDQQKLPNGAIWTGKYKKGNWIYFSFPTYTFSSSPAYEEEYKQIFKDMLNFAYYRNKGIKYPYLNSKKMIFISEDTEYMFKNLDNFSQEMKKLDVNATAFCVGKLAEKYPKMMKSVGKMDNIEIASHSYSHTDLLKASIKKLEKEITYNKKLLHKLSGQKIVGFRPPREQTNPRLIESLRVNGFKYVLEKNINRLFPKMFGSLMQIPRLGTDDYAYLIKLSWNKDQIIKNSIKEMKFITNLGGIYTLSTHTHLLSHPKNIYILEEMIKQFKKYNIPMLKGKDIVNKIIQTKQIDLKTSLTDENILVSIQNNNPHDVKNFTFRVYGDIESLSTDFLNIKAKIIKKTDSFVDVRITNLPKFALVTLFLKNKK